MIAAPTRGRDRWAALAVLTVPYLVGIVALDGLGTTVATFHSSDERVYHLPTILRFARDWPAPDLVHYRAAQAPLFHWVMAGASKIVGTEPWRLRLVAVAISYGAAVALLGLLRRRGHGWVPATALAALFALSPYVFGASFLVLTDGLGLLLAILALAACARVVGGAGVRWQAAAALWAGLALLTRQSLVWVVVVVAIATLAAPLSWRRRTAGLGLLALALVPFGALALAWGGLVPPGGDPTSCGLCGGAGPIDLRVPLLGLAALGAYAVALNATAVSPRAVLHEARAAWPGYAIAALAATAGLLIEPMTRAAKDDGLLWRAAQHGPAPGGSAAVFWLLVPPGAAALVALWRREARPPLGTLVAATAIATAVTVRLAYQKYVDPEMLLAVILAASPAAFAQRRSLIAPAALGVAFVAYALSFG